MEKLLFTIGTAIFGVAPLILLVLREHKRRRQTSRSPFSEKQLRPAGESLRLKIDILNEKFSNFLMMYLCISGFTPLVLILAPAPANPGILWVPAVILLIFEMPFLIFFGRKTLQVIRRRNDHELGFQGERAVGEELNQLLAEGCRVYHDLQFEGKPGQQFNIDHVVLSPMGVFAIETKTRRKPANLTGKAGSQIVFDGKTATMPWGENAFGIDQARRNAMHLAQWLSNSLGEQVLARPVLTFPGWFISSTGKGDVTVLNPKQIRQLVIQNGQHPRLSEKLLNQIKYQLEQKCRDIEVK